MAANKASERQKRYDDKNTRFIGLKLNNKTDIDILEQIEKVDNIQGYIKQAIREKLRNDGQKTD